MYRAIQALICEQWCRIRPALLIALCATPVCGGGVYLALHLGILSQDDVFKVNFGFSMLLLYWVLLIHGLCGLEEIGPAEAVVEFVPRRRLYRFPASTRLLVATIFGFRLAVAAFGCLFLAGFYAALFHGAGHINPLAAVCLALAGFAWLQAYLWLCGRTWPPVTVVTLAFVLAYIAGFVVYMRLKPEGFHLAPWLAQGPWPVLLGCAFSLPLAYGTAILGIALDRRAFWEDHLRPDGVLDFLASLFRRRRGFAQQREALMALESSRDNWLHLAVALPAAFFLTLFAAPDLFFLSGLLGVSLLLAFVTSAGLHVLATLNGGIDRFEFLRPVDIPTLAAARLRSGARRMILSAVAIFAVSALAFLLRLGDVAVYRMLPEFSMPSMLKALVVVVGFALMCWTLLWCANLLNVVLLAVVCVPALLCGAYMWATTGHVIGPKPDILYDSWYLTISLACLIGVVLMFRAAAKKRIIPTRTVVQCAAAWGIMAGLFLVWFFVLRGDYTQQVFIFMRSHSTIYDAILFLGLLALPLAPFASVPLTIEHARHSEEPLEHLF